MNYLQSVGAVQQTSLFNYRAAAERLMNQAFARTASATRVVVTLGVDGKNPVVLPFSDQELASDAFEGVIATPGTRAYVGMWERDGIIGDQHFAATQVVETRFTFEKLKSIAPVILGGAALIAAVVWFSRREKKSKRRRAAHTYRRRTTTVWR